MALVAWLCLPQAGRSFISRPMRALVLSFVFCLGFCPCQGAAQEARPQALEIGPTGEAYLDAIRYRGVEADVGYYDPTAAAPKLETNQTPPPPPPKPGAGVSLETLSTGRIIAIVLAGVLLIGLLLLIFRVSGNFTLSFQGDAQNPARARRTTLTGAFGPTATPADLAAILATSDRRRALVLLAQAALARTVTANGVLLQPSWTLRDALRHIPPGQAHLAALRNLVMTGEGVLFGNRDVTEAEFQARLADVSPLMKTQRG